MTTTASIKLTNTGYKTKNILLFYAVVLCLLFIVIVIVSDIYSTINLESLWLIIYFYSLLIILMRLKNGLLYEPFALVGGTYIVLMVPGTYLHEIVKGFSYDNQLANLIGLGYCSFALGLFLFKRLKSNYDNTQALPIGSQHPARSRDLLRVLLFVCILATFLLFAKGGIPLFSRDVDEARIDLFSGMGYLGIFFIGLRVISLAFLYDAWVSENRRRMTSSHLLAVVVVLLHVLTGFRSTTITFVGEYVGLYLMLGRGKLTIKWILVTIIVALIYVGTIGAHRRGGADISSVKEEIEIVFFARPTMFKFVVQLFDESRFFMGARYFQDLVKILPGSQAGANVDLKYEIFSHGQYRSMPSLAGLNPSILGEAYMNFGSMGVVAVPFVLGALLGWFYMKTQKMKSFAFCAIYITLLFNMAVAVAPGIGTVIVSLIYKWIWIMIVAFLYEKKVSMTSKSR